MPDPAMPADHDEQPSDDYEDQDTNPVPQPPRDAPLHLRMVLQTIRDPDQRQHLIDTYKEMGPGLAQELFGMVAAYLSAILDYGTARTAAHADELATIAEAIHQILASYNEALAKHESPRGTPAGPAALGAAMDDRLPAAVAEATKNALAPLIEAEGKRTEAAALSVSGRYLLTIVGIALAIGIILGLMFGHWLFHTNNP